MHPNCSPKHCVLGIRTAENSGHWLLEMKAEQLGMFQLLTALLPTKTDGFLSVAGLAVKAPCCQWKSGCFTTLLCWYPRQITHVVSGFSPSFKLIFVMRKLQFLIFLKMKTQHDDHTHTHWSTRFTKHVKKKQQAVGTASFFKMFEFRCSSLLWHLFYCVNV